MTNLYKAGIPLTVIQNFTGHKDFNELRRYLEHDEDAVENAVLILQKFTTPTVLDTRDGKFSKDVNKLQLDNAMVAL